MGLIVSWDIATAIALYVLGVAIGVAYYFASPREGGEGSRPTSRPPRGGDENLR